ncbi:MAG: hypothetical protein R3E86_07345 [Pseudomonadales bacterium]
MLHQAWQQWLSEVPAAPATDSGVLWLQDLALLRFSGADAAGFLQGYLTCDTSRLAPGHLTATALCNIKGRVVANGWCCADGDTVLLLVHHSLAERVGVFLKPYLTFSRTRLENETERVLVIAALDHELPTAALRLDERRQLVLLTELDAAATLWRGHPQLSTSAWLAALIDDRVPLVCAATSESFLPQMLELDRLGAVSFNKGCYLGQEVVARAQHRGQVKRRLRTLAWRGSPPVPGAELHSDDGRTQGTVLQSVATAAGSGTCLAVVQLDAPAALHEGDTGLSSAS